MAETEEKKCPCKQKLSDGQKGVLNFGLSSEMLKDPNAAAVGIAKQLGGRNSNRIDSIIQAYTIGSGLPGGGGGGGGIGGFLDSIGASNFLPSLTRTRNQVNSLSGLVDAFGKESARLSTVEGLLSTVSSLSLYAELSCALGIEGLDIGVGLNVVNQNGQFAIQSAIAANVDLEKILNQFGDGGVGTELAENIQKLQSGIDGAFEKLDEVNNGMNELLEKTQQIQNEAADLIKKYTDISALADLINQADIDPCFKLGSTINGSLVSPEFLNTIRGANPAGLGTFR